MSSSSTSLKQSFAWNQISLLMNENNKIFSMTQPMNHHHSKHCTIIPESMKLCKQISNAVTHHPTTMIKLDLWHSASANNVSRASTSVDKRWRHGRQGSIAEGRIAQRSEPIGTRDSRGVSRYQGSSNLEIRFCVGAFFQSALSASWQPYRRRTGERVTRQREPTSMEGEEETDSLCVTRTHREKEREKERITV